MSVKAQIKGFIYKVSEPYTVGNNGTEKQDLILKQPARLNEFGEVKGKDEYFKLEIVGKKVAELNGKPPCAYASPCYHYAKP